MSLLKNNREYFMKMALKEAEIAYEEDEIPVGAIVFSQENSGSLYS